MAFRPDPLLRELAAAERAVSRERERQAAAERAARARLADLEHRVQVLRDALGALGLRSGGNIGTMTSGTMLADAPRAKRAGRGRPPQKDHVLVRTLAERGSSVAKWAREHGLSRIRVQTWISEGPHRRSIPMEYARAIERELGIPLSTWGDRIR